MVQKSGIHQFRLVVYPTIYKGFIHPRRLFGISEPSTVWKQLKGRRPLEQPRFPSFDSPEVKTWRCRRPGFWGYFLWRYPPGNWYTYPMYFLMKHGDCPLPIWRQVACNYTYKTNFRLRCTISMVYWKWVYTYSIWRCTSCVSQPGRRWYLNSHGLDKFSTVSPVKNDVCLLIRSFPVWYSFQFISTGRFSLPP